MVSPVKMRIMEHWNPRFLVLNTCIVGAYKVFIYMVLKDMYFFPKCLVGNRYKLIFFLFSTYLKLNLSTNTMKHLWLS